MHCEVHTHKHTYIIPITQKNSACINLMIYGLNKHKFPVQTTEEHVGNCDA